MARSIAIINEKGGTGKTTTEVNMGAALDQNGYRVLLADIDPQASAALSLGFRDEHPRSVNDVFIRRSCHGE